MYRAVQALAGIVAIGLVAVFLVGALFAAPVDARTVIAPSNTSSLSGTASPAAVAVPAGHVTPLGSGPHIQLNSTFGGTTAIPYTTLKVYLAGTADNITNATTSIGWNVTDTSTGVQCTSGWFTYLIPPTDVQNVAFTTTLSAANFSTAQLACNTINTDVDQFSIWAVVNGTGSNVASQTTTFTLGSSAAIVYNTAVPATSTLPQSISVKVTVVNGNISTANLTVSWTLWNTGETGACASGSFSYLVANSATPTTTQTITGDLTAANFTGAYLNPGCSTIYSAPLALTFTAVMSGTDNFWTNTTYANTIVIVPTAVSVTETSVLPTYTELPTVGAAVNFTIVVASGTISTNNLTLWANITDAISFAVCGSINLDSLVVNTSSNTASYSFALSTGTLPAESALATACPDILVDPVLIVVGATLNGTGAPYNAQVASSDSNATGTTASTSLVFILPTGSLNFAIVTTAPYTYNFTATFSGQYVGRVQLTVYSATVVNGNHTVIFSANFVQTPYAVWYQPKAGTYPYTLAVLAPYANQTSSGVLALTSSTPVYTNTTTWHNTTAFGGLSPAVGGTILLLVGLIIGMLVVLLLGAAIFGGRSQTPPQAWESTTTTSTTTTGAGANTCSVCGKSFDNPEDLAAHGKTEHGLQ
jgi:hypothetical protein